MKIDYDIEDSKIIESILERLRDEHIPVSVSRFIGSKKYTFESKGNITPGEEDRVREIIKEERVKYRLKNIDLYDIDNLRNYNLSQILNYIDNNMNDINTAKMIVKKIVRVLWYLLKRDMEDL